MANTPTHTHADGTADRTRAIADRTQVGGGVILSHRYGRHCECVNFATSWAQRTRPVKLHLRKTHTHTPTTTHKKPPPLARGYLI